MTRRLIIAEFTAIAALLGGSAAWTALSFAQGGQSHAASGCTVTDGDTIRCGDERIRLIGMDAPEMPGHCRPGRDCVPGDPVASSDALVRLLHAGSLRIERHGQDRYGRTLAYVSVQGRDLSCAMIGSGHAIYVERWDVAHRLGGC